MSEPSRYRLRKPRNEPNPPCGRQLSPKERGVIYAAATNLYASEPQDEVAIAAFIAKSKYHRWCIMHIIGPIGWHKLSDEHHG